MMSLVSIIHGSGNTRTFPEDLPRLIHTTEACQSVTHRVSTITRILRTTRSILSTPTVCSECAGVDFIWVMVDMPHRSVLISRILFPESRNRAAAVRLLHQ